MSVVPERVDLGGDELRVGRAWPKDLSADRLSLRVEGRDGSDRLRAGELDLTRSRGRWQVGEVRVLPFATDPRLPGLAGLDGTLLVHRGGRRAVLREAGSYTKVVRPGALDAVLQAHRTGARLAARAGWAAPAAEVVPDRPGTIRLSTVPGAPLHDLGVRGDEEAVRRGWGAFAEGWPEVVAGDASELPAHDASAEVQIAERAVRQALDVWSPPAQVRLGVERALDLTVAALLGDAGAPAVPSHRDLHDKQLLVGEGLGLLDLDTAARAEPELDLANLLEHVRLRGRQGLWSPAVVALGEEGVRRAAERVGADPRRLAAYRAATRLRLAGVYLFRPRWAGLARAELERMAAAPPLMRALSCGS